MAGTDEKKPVKKRPYTRRKRTNKPNDNVLNVAKEEATGNKENNDANLEKAVAKNNKTRNKTVKVESSEKPEAAKKRPAPRKKKAPQNKQEVAEENISAENKVENVEEQPKKSAPKKKAPAKKGAKKPATKKVETKETSSRPVKRISFTATEEEQSKFCTTAKPGKLQIIPLGGLGEVGKNMTAIRYGNNIIVIDAGMTFPDEEMLGIDLVIPDATYLFENKKYVKGFFITHGHEDHIGSLPYVMKEMVAPIYAGKLGVGLIKNKFKEHNIKNVPLNEVKQGDVIKVGCFEVEFIRVSHSIPDSYGLAVKTPIGTVVHTGDFKIDLTPVDGEAIDLKRFAELGREGVLALMADSTNVEKDGYTASETTVGPRLENVFHTTKGRIILTTFASNVHRVQQAIWAAEQTNRKVAFVGRGMINVSTIALELGYLTAKAGTIVEVEETKKLPDNKVVIITTGSQGESLSGLNLMALDEHRHVQLRQGDTVVISANAIPGNEKLISRMVDNLCRHNVEVVYGQKYGIHVSGHASSEELKMLLNIVKPEFFIPVHGEYRMLHAHCQLAASVGINPDNIFQMENGQVLELDKKKGVFKGRVPSGQVLIDGRGVGDVGATVLKDRKQLSNHGIVIVALTVDTDSCTLVHKPEVITRGFVFEKQNEEFLEEIGEKAISVFEKIKPEDYNISVLKGNLRGNVGKLVFDKTGRKPIIMPIVIEF